MSVPVHVLKDTTLFRRMRVCCLWSMPQRRFRRNLQRHRDEIQSGIERVGRFYIQEHFSSELNSGFSWPLATDCELAGRNSSPHKKQHIQLTPILSVNWTRENGWLETGALIHASYLTLGIKPLAQ